MTAILVASLSFSLLAAHADGPYKCGRYRATGFLKDAQTLVVNQGKQGATTLRLNGKYQKFAKAGFAVEVEGEIKKEIVNYEGEIEIKTLKLIVPDPISNNGDELRLVKAKPCR
jgi:hypothetical protein